MAPRVSLLGKFTGLSLLAMVALAFVIGMVLHGRIEARALTNAEQLTGVIAKIRSSILTPRPLRPETSTNGRSASTLGSYPSSRAVACERVTISYE